MCIIASHCPALPCSHPCVACTFLIIDLCRNPSPSCCRVIPIVGAGGEQVWPAGCKAECLYASLESSIMAGHAPIVGGEAFDLCFSSLLRRLADDVGYNGGEAVLFSARVRVPVYDARNVSATRQAHLHVTNWLAGFSALVHLTVTEREAARRALLARLEDVTELKISGCSGCGGCGWGAEVATERCWAVGPTANMCLKLVLDGECLDSGGAGADLQEQEGQMTQAEQPREQEQLLQRSQPSYMRPKSVLYLTI